MKKRLITLLIIICIVIPKYNITAFAEESDIPTVDENANTQMQSNPVYKVVLSTNYGITVDPIDQANSGSMIISPDYYIINKSNVPIQVDVSMKISSRDGTLIDFMPNKSEVTDKDSVKRIWLAAVAPLLVNTTTNSNVVLKTPDGRQVYAYENFYSTKPSIVTGSAITLVKKDTVQKIEIANELENAADTVVVDKVVDKVADTVTDAVTGSAIIASNINTATGSAISLGEKETIYKLEIADKITSTVDTMVTGSDIIPNHITIMNIENYGANIEAAADGIINAAEAVSGSAITVDELETVTGSAITVDELETVTGSATTVDELEAATGSAITVDKLEAATGSAITVEEVKVVTGSAITVDKAEIIKQDIDAKIVWEGKTLYYTDTLSVVGFYGNISSLTDKSPNVVTLGETDARMTFVLSNAKEYLLDDGMILTGAVADNNKGVAAFHFIGTVNPNANWSKGDFTVTIKYDITGISSQYYYLLTNGDTDDGDSSNNGYQTLVGLINSRFNIYNEELAFMGRYEFGYNVMEAFNNSGDSNDRIEQSIP